MLTAPLGPGHPLTGSPQPAAPRTPGHHGAESPPAPPVHRISLPSDLLSLPPARSQFFSLFFPQATCGSTDPLPQGRGADNFPKLAQGEPSAWVPARASYPGGRAVMENKDFPHIFCIKQRNFGDRHLSARTAGDALGGLWRPCSISPAGALSERANTAPRRGLRVVAEAPSSEREAFGLLERRRCPARKVLCAAAWVHGRGSPESCSKRKRCKLFSVGLPLVVRPKVSLSAQLTENMSKRYCLKSC